MLKAGQIIQRWLGKETSEPELKMLFDGRMESYAQLVDVFPEAAYGMAKAKDDLEKLDEARLLQMGKEVNPEKEKTATYLSILDNKGKLSVRVTEGWLDKDENRVAGTTTEWNEFPVDKLRVVKLLKDISEWKNKNGIETPVIPSPEGKY